MHYLDYSATTPLLPEVAEAMLSSMRDNFGNPSSVHGAGRRARAAVEEAREKVAAAVGAKPSEIVFTGGGSEADNLALKGAVTARRDVGGSEDVGDHLVTTTFEHHAILDSAHWLERQGCKLTLVDPGSDGLVRPETVAAAVRPETVIVSVMSVNNEIGTVQPMADIAAAVQEVDQTSLVHTDAVQALGNIPVDLGLWAVDLASFAAHKLGGPKGVGALFVRSGVGLEALIHGGGHERGLRSGTLNVPGITGFGVAAELAAKEVHDKAERLTALRRLLLEGLRTVVPDLVVNGDLSSRVPGNLHVSVPGAEGETLLMLLDAAGIACSTGSACQSGAVDPSHVLLAIGVPTELAQASIRFTLGRDSTPEDIDAVLEAFPEIVRRAEKAA